ncbi:hypothetical protein IEQ34_013306 [Dendrobium chrysotoxum]|uniref:Maturase K n=1 Tax=Dendrobium chrysotoxum TaxID=161865 RepID=A0AAV7GNA5_DENCH|nr:hypothetical protein IEQ34_013306 [Dendrobium chrysotoxum]
MEHLSLWIFNLPYVDSFHESYILKSCIDPFYCSPLEMYKDAYDDEINYDEEDEIIFQFKFIYNFKLHHFNKLIFFKMNPKKHLKYNFKNLNENLKNGKEFSIFLRKFKIYYLAYFININFIKLLQLLSCIHLVSIQLYKRLGLENNIYIYINKIRNDMIKYNSTY